MPNAITDQELNKPNKQVVDREPVSKRAASLIADGITWVPTWRELSVWQNPTRGVFAGSTPNNGSKIDHLTIIDNHARRCIRDFASGMISGLTSPARPWFALGLEDQDLSNYGPVKWYLDRCQTIMHSVFGKSNVYECLHILYEELATFGTAAMFLQEDYTDIIRGRSFTIGEYYLGVGPDGRVNAFVRPYWMTVAQIVKEFGFENCSQSVRSSFKNHQTERRVKVNLLIEENDRRMPEYMDWKNMPYRAFYFEEGSIEDTYLRIEGYEEFPVLAPRWALTTSADVYGKSAGWDALGDVKMLQKEQRDKLLALAKAGNPPMQADASVQNVNTLPGGLTRSSSTVPNTGVRPAYQVNPDFNGMREDILEIKKALDDAYYRDLFKGILNIDRTGVTATEIAEKKAEQLNMASPLILRITNEVCNPKIARAFAIMNRMGILPPPPREIQGQEIKIKYISIFAQAQKMVGISAIDQWVGSVYQDASVLGPSALDILNVDEKNTEKAYMYGIPAKIVASPEQIAYKKKVRAEAEARTAKAQQMAMGIELLGKGTKAAKDASETKMGSGSMLDTMAEKMPQGMPS